MKMITTQSDWQTTDQSVLDRLCDQITCADSMALLPELPADSIDLVVTSPPYFRQRDYGGGIGNEDTPDAYIAALMPAFAECVRVIKPSGSIIWNLGDKYDESNLLLMPYRFALAVAGQHPVRLVNTIMWAKTNPTPRQFKRRLVSSTEPFFHFVKSDAYFYAMDAFMQGDEPKAPREPKADSNIGKSYFELIAQSALTDSQKDLARTALQTVIEEVQRGEIEGFRMKIRGIHSEPFGGQDGGRKIQLDRNGFTIIRIHGNPIKRDYIVAPVESLKGSPHPAVYPVKLVEEFLRLLTLPGDLVLDPFVGSGTTAVAAAALSRRFIGIDINPIYCDYARTRLDAVQKRLI